jgi:phosphohistidine phosphatase
VDRPEEGNGEGELVFTGPLHSGDLGQNIRMVIYFLRHANAGEPRLDSASDEKRPLDKLGVNQSHDMGRVLAALDIKLDVIISSPLLRAFQTAELIAEELGHKAKITTDAALRPEASYEKFQDLLRRYSGKKAILVAGHNPSLTDFLNRLLNGGTSMNVIEMKKGAVAKVETNDHDSAVLKWYLPPKVARALQDASASSSRPKTVSK